MDIKSSQIKYILAVLECGSISSAAKKLYISQPTLSGNIINLEKQLGVTLFDRTTIPLRLTSAGEIFVKNGMQIIDIYKRLEQEIVDLDDTPQGRIIVGSSPYITTYILPRVLVMLKKQYPKIDVSLVEVSRSEREKAALEGDIDLYFTTTPFDKDDERFQYTKVTSDRILLSLPASHHLNRPDTEVFQNNVLLPRMQSRSYPYSNLPPEEDFPIIDLYSLKSDPFILPPPRMGLTAILLKSFKLLGFTPKIILESQSMDAIRSMVSLGLGNGFIFESLVRYGSPCNNIIYNHLYQIRPTRNLFLAYRKGMYHSKAITEFIRTVQYILRSPVI